MKNKIKLLNNRPEISDSELNELMDFEALMARDQALADQADHPEVRNSRRYLYWLGLCLLLLLVGGYWMSLGKKEVISSTGKTSQNNTTQIQSSATIDNTTDLEADELIKVPIEDSEKNALKNNIENNSSVKKGLLTPKKDHKSNDLKPHDVKREIASQQKSKIANAKLKQQLSTNHIPPSGYDFVEAQPKMGEAALQLYLQEAFKNNISPPSANTTIENLMVNFTIDVNGKAEAIQMEKSLGTILDQEIIAIIKAMPEWNPAVINGTKIKSNISIPLSIKLEL